MNTEIEEDRTPVRPGLQMLGIVFWLFVFAGVMFALVVLPNPGMRESLLNAIDEMSPTVRVSLLVLLFALAMLSILLGRWRRK